jgi:hypothetical protein
MNIFFYQPEYLSTINVILGQMVGTISLVGWCGIIFIIVLLVGLICSRRFGWKLQSVVMISLLIGWLPLACQFMYSTSIEFSKTAPFVNAPLSEQILWRYCRIDHEQRLGGGFCSLYPFSQEVIARVPQDKTLYILSSNIGIYLRYFLYGRYEVTDTIDKADYILLYRSAERFELTKGVLYRVTEQGKQELAQVEVVGQPAANEVIFKKIRQ